MNSRLPPAWSKHLKASSGPRISTLPKAKPEPPAQTDDMLLRQAFELQQLKRFGQAQEPCFRVLERTPNHPVALYVMGTLALGYDGEGPKLPSLAPMRARKARPRSRSCVSGPTNGCDDRREERAHTHDGSSRGRRLLASVTGWVRASATQVHFVWIPFAFFASQRR